MKYIYLCALMIFSISCNKAVITQPPLSYSVMPEYLDLDSIQPLFNLDTNDVIDSSFIDFKSMPLDSGTLYTIYGDTLRVSPGILISDKKAVLYIFYKESYERYQKEAKYAKYLMKTYYNKAKASEVLYQDEIVRLKEEARRTWLEKNLIYLGFAAGLVTALITEFAVVNVSE